jgi:high-affinity nickel-transport protein
MLGAYGWAYRNPVRKLLYNASITVLSVALAFVIAGIEASGLLVEHFGVQGAVWDGIAGLNAGFGTLGFGIVVLFAVCWIASAILFHANSYVRRNERA